MVQAVYVVLCALAASVVIHILRKTNRLFRTQSKKLPPSPPPHLFIGHVLQLPQTKQWLYFEQLSKTYGSMVRLSLAGDEILVLNDARDAEELLNRRANNYSSRKPLVYAGKYQSKDKRLLLLSYGEELRKHRAAFHTMLQLRVVGSYETLQEKESLRLLHYTLEQPSEMWLNTRRYAAAIVYTLAFGKDIDKDGSDDLFAVLDIVEGFVRECMPGSHLVDTFPVLDLLPDILAPWRKQALRKHEFEMKLYQRLLLEAKEKNAKLADATDSFASRLWDDNDKLNLDMVSMSYVVGSAVEAGTDTTTSTMLWFLTAAILYPDTVRKAQEEIDRVVGADGSTIPTFANVNDLPYCFAFAKEVLRWMPAGPSGFPRYSDQDDEYKGYFIPKKTTVIPNIWSMHRNEQEFPEASKFVPERFLKDMTYPIKLGDLSLGHYGFGFGRRNCPGKYLAVQSVWIGVVRMMWAFHITHAQDANGEAIPIDPMDCTSGITTKPKEFPLQIKPRSSTHEETMRRECIEILN